MPASRREDTQARSCVSLANMMPFFRVAVSLNRPRPNVLYDLSIEHNSFVSIEQHPPLTDPLYRGSEHIALYIAALRCKLLRIQRVIDSNNILLNDRTLIEIRCHEVRGRSNDLYAPIVGLVVRLGALE